MIHRMYYAVLAETSGSTLMLVSQALFITVTSLEGFVV